MDTWTEQKLHGAYIHTDIQQHRFFTLHKFNNKLGVGRELKREEGGWTVSCAPASRNRMSEEDPEIQKGAGDTLPAQPWRWRMGTTLSCSTSPTGNKSKWQTLSRCGIGSRKEKSLCMIQNLILNDTLSSYPWNTYREIVIMHLPIKLKSLVINPTLHQGGQAEEKSQQHYNCQCQQGRDVCGNPHL